jgi:hypothetical protein
MSLFRCNAANSLIVSASCFDAKSRFFGLSAAKVNFAAYDEVFCKENTETHEVYVLYVFLCFCPFRALGVDV